MRPPLHMWTPRRDAVLLEGYATGVPTDTLIERVNALPGPPLTNAAQVHNRAKNLHLRRPKMAHKPQRGRTGREEIIARSDGHYPAIGALLDGASQQAKIRSAVADCLAAGMSLAEIAEEVRAPRADVVNHIAALRRSDAV